MGKVIEINGIRYELINAEIIEVTKEGEKLGDIFINMIIAGGPEPLPQ